MTSPSCLDIEIAKSEADKITLLKERIKIANSLTELRKQINDITNQIAENATDGYNAVSSIQKLMEAAAQAEYYQKDSIETEKYLDLRIAAIKKTRDLRMQIAGLEHFNVPRSKLDSIRAEFDAANAHTNKIFENSLMGVYSHPDTPKAEVKAEHVTADVKVREAKTNIPAKPQTLIGPESKQMDPEKSYKHYIAHYIGWDKSTEPKVRFHQVSDIDQQLIDGCKADDVLAVSIAVNSGALDFDGGLAMACAHNNGKLMRALHMLNCGATDVQLGLVCGLWANSFEIIRLMLANGAKVTDDIIAYAAKLKKPSSIKHIVFPGSRNVSRELQRKICDDMDVAKSIRDYIEWQCDI